MSAEEISLITQMLVALSDTALWGFVAFLLAKFVIPALLPGAFYAVVWVVLVVLAFRTGREYMRQRASLNRERQMLRGLMAACGFGCKEGEPVDQFQYLEMADLLACGMEARKKGGKE